MGGSQPQGDHYGMARFSKVVFALSAASAITSSAQTFTTLASFSTSAGYQPNASLVQGVNGNLFGTTEYSDESNGGLGTVFEITPAGTLGTLGSFDYSDGADPQAGPVQANNADLYGTASTGGANSAGTVFQISPSGTLTALYSFCSVISSAGRCADGLSPNAPLIQATNGNFYGTTNSGGTARVSVARSLRLPRRVC